MPPEKQHLVIDVDTAAQLRTQVGPIGWLVVEAIATQSPPGIGTVEALCSSRSLAGNVGVSKDSVARALRSLIDAGVIERVDRREASSGHFASSTYRIDLPTP
jgi:DNA-binding MarR family transcriptional regulator